VRAVGLHPDVMVVTSRFWQTTCTLVRSGPEAFCIDSPVLPDELEILPAIAEQASFNVVGLLATHADWDHLLGRYAFADAPLGVAETTALRLRNEPGDAQRKLRGFDDSNYIERPGPLGLPGPQVLPVPGRCDLGEQALELHVTEGHTADGMAIWIPWASVLVAGDYLSPVEIPVLGDGGSIEAYAATLDRLRPLVADAQFIVPGHGASLGSERALSLLAEDLDYLQALGEHGVQAELPEGRRSKIQRVIHAENLARI
jgi:hydroxyacylglutathione hydrolase